MKTVLRCPRGHVVESAPCETCLRENEEDRAFRVALGRPPREMTIRPRDGGTPIVYRIPAHAQRRRRRA